MVLHLGFAECRLLRNCGRGYKRETSNRTGSDCLVEFAVRDAWANSIKWDEGVIDPRRRSFLGDRLEIDGSVDGSKSVGPLSAFRLQR